MNKFSIIMYHYVRDLRNSRFPKLKALDYKLFKEQINYFKRNFHLLTIEELFDVFYSNSKLKKNSLLLTFDDGYIDHFNFVFPILDSLKIQGLFYPPVAAIRNHTVLDVNKIHLILALTGDVGKIINEIKLLCNKYRSEYELNSFDFYLKQIDFTCRYDTQEVVIVKKLLQVVLPKTVREKISTEIFENVVDMDESMFSRELYLNEDQLKCMNKNGMHIGSHGFNHEWLGHLDDYQQNEEINNSVVYLRELFGTNLLLTIAFPYGNYNKSTLNILEKYDFKFGFTTQAAEAFVKKDSNNALLLPRFDTNDFLLF